MPEMDCPRACGHKITTKVQFEPKIGPLGNLLGYAPRTVVNQDDLRRHLLDHHGPRKGFSRPRMIR